MKRNIKLIKINEKKYDIYSDAMDIFGFESQVRVGCLWYDTTFNVNEWKVQMTFKNKKMVTKEMMIKCLKKIEEIKNARR